MGDRRQMLSWYVTRHPGQSLLSLSLLNGQKHTNGDFRKVLDAAWTAANRLREFTGTAVRCCYSSLLPATVQSRILQSVYVYVCLYLCQHAYLKKHAVKLHKIFCTR